MRKPLIIAHRGDSINFPENTIEAFKSAFEYGADGIELDVHLDEKEHVIVVHNYLFDKDKNYPLLRDILREFGHKGRLEIEIKSLNPKCVTEVKKLIKKYNPKDFEITSSVLPLFPYIIKEFPNEKVGLIFQAKLTEEWMPREFIEQLVLNYMKLTGATILHLPFEYYTKAYIDLMHKNGFLTHVYLKTLEAKRYEEIKNLGIDQIATDNVSLIRLA